MTGLLLTTSAGPPGPSATTTAVTGQPSTTVPGPRQDSADFYGVFGAVAIIIGAIIVIRLAFRRPRRPRGPAGPAPGAPAEPMDLDPDLGRSPAPERASDPPSAPSRPSFPRSGEQT